MAAQEDSLSLLSPIPAAADRSESTTLLVAKVSYHTSLPVRTDSENSVRVRTSWCNIQLIRNAICDTGTMIGLNQFKCSSDQVMVCSDSEFINR
jgi:hypothetical protein